jgi:hypothetical protein
MFYQYLGNVCQLVAENLDEKEVALFFIAKRGRGMSGGSVYIQPRMKYFISLENIGNELMVINKSQTNDRSRPKIGVSVFASESY